MFTHSPPPAITQPHTPWARFGRIARSYPLPARGSAPQNPAQVVRPGLTGRTAQALSRWLATLVEAMRLHAQARSRERRAALTRRALQALDEATLRDIGVARCEIVSLAAEAAGQIEATRHRLWLELGLRSV